MDIKHRGLDSEEAKKLLVKHGSNELKQKEKVNPFKIFLNQFKSSLIIILIVAAIVLGFVNFFLGEKNFIDVILILSIVFISGISSFIQDYKAEKSIEALQGMLVPKVKVMRDGRPTMILSVELVPGDILLLESGDVIPADAKLLEANNLQINESTLTGESVAVNKGVGKEIFMNTFISSGNAIALVTLTGMNTKMGKIADKLGSIEEEKTQFNVQMDDLSKKLSWIILFIIIAATIVNLFKYDIVNSIMIAIALAIAAIPEGMSAVLTLSLAASSRVMIYKNALVRKLSTIGSIGSVNYICSDKTGTITQNKMTVTKIYSNREEKNLEDIRKEDVEELLLCNVLNNNTTEIFEKELKIRGDETEIALRNFADRFGYFKTDLESNYKRVYEIPFDSKRKMMSVVVSNKSKLNLYSKGAPERIIERCNKILVRGNVMNLREHEKKKILEMNNEFASRGLRVLGFAYKNLRKLEKNENKLENDLIFIGLEGIIDPPNEGVRNAILECETAGIEVIMLTGDNPLTAKAISDEVGIKTKKILTGENITKLSDKELYKEVKEGCHVFARLTPEEKLRIMTILQDNGNVVAMTGDGVNDALALKKADVGIAMGIKGTDVAKEASDIILVDDNFVTIVSAIKEGRRVFDNIRKFTNYLLSCNLAEVAVIFIATIFLTLKNPILLPIHLLWINLLTDGFPALALGMDPAREDIMKEPPRKKNEKIIDKRLYFMIGSTSILISFLLLGVFLIVLKLTQNEILATTSTFTAFVLYEFLRIMIIRREEKIKLASNRFLLITIILSIFVQLIIVYTPLNNFFSIVPLGVAEWGILAGGGVVGYVLSLAISNYLSKKFG